MKKGLDRVQKAVIKLYLWALGLGGAYVLWLKLTGKGLPCVVNASTGLLCPGCGCSRMFLALLRGDLGAAWGYNPVTLVLLAVWNGIGAAVFLGKPKFVRKSAILYGALAVTVGVLAVFGIVRNL